MRDQEIQQLLAMARRIAVVGLSAQPTRPSYGVAQYLLRHGYTILPVNPGLTTVLGLPCYPDLRAVPGPVDIVNVFRRSDQVGPVVDAAIAIGARAVWLQLGVIDHAAAARAAAAGLQVVMDRCIKIDHLRWQ